LPRPSRVEFTISLYREAQSWPELANQLGIHALGVELPIAFFANLSAKRRLSRAGATMQPA
jgi:hypothetical protein